jgi:hypothetical protein
MRKQTGQNNSKEDIRRTSAIARPLSERAIPQAPRRILLIASILLTLGIGIYFLFSSHAHNGYWGFPLDDPWIHLTFARNLADYGSYSYFKNEHVISGSTSPLYTSLLAFLFLFSKNEFIISYVLGILFSAVTIFFIFKLFARHFRSFPWLGAAATIFVAIDPKLNLISVSGMETTMFIALIAMAFHFYNANKPIWLGLVLGLTVWCRPDGFVVWIAIIVDYLVRTNYMKSQLPGVYSETWNKKGFFFAFGIAGILTIVYFGFNFALSGDLLPNTYNAKLAFYQRVQRSDFLKSDVIGYFTSKEFAIVWPPFLIGLIAVLVDFIKRRRNEFFVYPLFVVGFLLTYFLLLPYSHRFGRYLMPVIPFFVLTAFYGIRITFSFLIRKNTPAVLVNSLLVAFVLVGLGLSSKQIGNSCYEYTARCKYQNDRQVAAGKWLKAHAPEGSVVATHDIGAIAYYSELNTIDLVGLVTPELVSHINSRDYSAFLNEYLSQAKVDYLVTLRNWLEVVNVNPVFVPVDEYEYLEVFEYKAGKTHIMPKRASLLNKTGLQLMVEQNRASDAEKLFQRSLEIDPNSSATLFLLGAAAESRGDLARGISFYQKALQLFPGYPDANFAMARVNYNEGQNRKAMEYVRKCLKMKPDYGPALDLESLIINRARIGDGR